MTEPCRLPDRDEFAAALAWWRSAGVDHDFADDATDWLAEPDQPAAAATASVGGSGPASAARPPAPPVEIRSAPVLGGEQGGWPEDLATFHHWWLTEPLLEAGGTGPRIVPRGAQGAALMVIVAHPEEEDREALLSGPQGRLLTGFLRATGIGAEQAYLASVVPRFTAAPDWASLGASGAGRLLAHHIGLVQPDRIVFLGRNILPLLGHDTAQEGKTLRRFNHKGRNFPFVEGQGLARLLRSAAARRDLWQSWLDGTDG
ncbi:hypothetical protein U4960_10750 [Altererythrobacter sp. H2]|uniref:hypothetical protein n=1 Tax=Altererythrobacter sp. H2 TaxID=3108391 RepID=UPI002B4BDE9D|nr:hypothetical protein [Altererythrobacter sp. H2]WRK94776.1 hypothetical protein U4960_10750 [Altererythrobacter sp. H2]